MTLILLSPVYVDGLPFAPAPADGVIARISDHEHRGCSIVVRGEDGVDYYITHLTSACVGVGQRVREDEPIGALAA